MRLGLLGVVLTVFVSGCGEVNEEHFFCEGTGKWASQRIEIYWQDKTVRRCNHTGCYNFPDAIFTGKTVSLEFNERNQPMAVFNRDARAYYVKSSDEEWNPSATMNCSLL